MLDSLYSFIFLIDELLGELLTVLSNSSLFNILRNGIEHVVNAIFKLFNNENIVNIDYDEFIPALLILIVVIIAFRFVIKTIKRVINAITMTPEKKRRY